MISNQIYSFSPAVLKYLKAAGWRPGRKVTTKHWESFLRNANNPVYPVVVEFLQEFGGLEVDFPDPGNPGDINFFHISPTDAAEHYFIDEDCLSNVNAWAGCALCAIGAASPYHMLLLMSADGRVFLRHGDFLWLIGMSGYDAIEKLCTTKDNLKQFNPPES